MDDLLTSARGVELSRILAGIADKINEHDVSNKQVDDIRKYLTELRALLDNLTIHSAFKTTLISYIENIEASLDEMSGEPTLPTSVKSPLRSLPEIHLQEFSVLPATKEIVVNGKHYKVPPAELRIILALAVEPGRAVTFETGPSFYTRLSRIRRDFPLFKKLIERVSPGIYVLHATKK